MVARLPRLGSRRGGGREQEVGERVGQTAYAEGPDRALLCGPGGTYVMHYFCPVPEQPGQGCISTPW